MIAQLTGTVLRKDDGRLVLGVGGVGYLVHCAIDTITALPTGSSATLRVHTNVREDALELFGFLTELEEALFHELCRVPGVGPKTALSILSGAPPVETARMIVEGDLVRLKKLPGVGKKTAERLVVELPDRLRPLLLSLPGGAATVAPRASDAKRPAADDLLLALAELGFRPAEAERMAAAAREKARDAPLDQLVREALRAR